MIGSINSEHKEVTIVGAGVAGMLAAYYLDKKGYEVTLLEAAPRAGGLIKTVRTPFGIAESGAHSVLATETVRELAREIGVELAEVKKDSRARYILRKGKLRKFPLTATETISAIFRAYFFLSERNTAPERVSLERWASRFLGKPALQYLFTPFVRGIYGAEPRDITVGAAFPSLVVPRGHSLLSSFFGKMIRAPFRSSSHKSKRSRGHGKMMAPAHGMGSLTDALESVLERLLGTRFKKGQPVRSLPTSPNIILAVPALEAAKLLEREDPQLSSALRLVPYTPMVSVTAFVESENIKTGPEGVRGVGVLAPALEGRDALGILFNSSSFPNRVTDDAKCASFTIMMGGSAHPEWIDAPDERIADAVAHELRDLLELKQKPAHLVIHRWQRAIPQYGAALQDSWEAAHAGWCARPGRVLFGNYTGQVSLRGMIESAESL